MIRKHTTGLAGFAVLTLTGMASAQQTPAQPLNPAEPATATSKSAVLANAVEAVYANDADALKNLSQAQLSAVYKVPESQMMRFPEATPFFASLMQISQITESMQECTYALSYVKSPANFRVPVMWPDMALRHLKIYGDQLEKQYQILQILADKKIDPNVMLTDMHGNKATAAGHFASFSMGSEEKFGVAWNTLRVAQAIPNIDFTNVGIVEGKPYSFIEYVALRGTKDEFIPQEAVKNNVTALAISFEFGTDPTKAPTKRARNLVERLRTEYITPMSAMPEPK